MGCNAQNHRADCNCGFGGDTGGGGLGRFTIGPAAPVTGLWKVSDHSNYDSYVNPNARCPVCSDGVFFYQSPNGGRVFFDELGPPWPKHPCTDTSYWRRSTIPPDPPLFHRRATKAPLPNPNQWQPLTSNRFVRGSHLLLHVDASDSGLPATYLHVRPGPFDSGPAYWRRYSRDLSRIELSTIVLSQDGTLKDHREVVAAWLGADDSALRLAIDITPSADDYNLLGWGLSFYWAPKTHIALHPRQRLVTEWGLREASIIDWLDHPAVDLFAARAYFEKAAEGNSWEGMTNLGVMLRDGIGGPADQARAARLLERAAEALDPIPIHQLSKCYRDGVGVEVDPQHAAYLSELAKVREDELRDELWRTVDGWASKTRGAT